MAVVGGVDVLLGGLEANTKRVLQRVFEYVLKNWRFGRPGHQVRTENFTGAFLEGTTHSVANTAFSIEHGLEHAPYLAIPVLDLQTVGSEIVPLAVAQAADSRRVYLKSAETSAPISIYVE